MTTLATVRSLLFVPGDDERKLHHALATEADAVVADLEDAVLPEQKANARKIVAEALAPDHLGGPLRLVRINGAGTADWEEDVASLASLVLDGIVLPKASPEAVEALGADGPPVVAIAETADGVRRAHELATTARVAALMLGAIDLGRELLYEPRPDGHELLYARSKLVLDSAAAGIRGPFDGVYGALRDTDGLAAECRLARSLGLRGKACIHPAQVEVVNRAFAPNEGELAWAERVLAAYRSGREEGRGAVGAGGEMVDAAVVERARRLLEEGGRE
jgi:citrate lyase subunit beta/citryl-CoA lyase